MAEFIVKMTMVILLTVIKYATIAAIVYTTYSLLSGGK